MGGSSEEELSGNEIPQQFDFFSHHPWRWVMHLHDISSYNIKKTYNILFLIERPLELRQCIQAVVLPVETRVVAHQMPRLGKEATALEGGTDTDPGPRTFRSGTL